MNRLWRLSFIFAIVWAALSATSAAQTISHIDDQPDCGGGACSPGSEYSGFYWEWNPDPGTPGLIGSMASELNTSIQLDGQSREFDVNSAESGAGFIAHIYTGSTNVSCADNQFFLSLSTEYSDTSRLVNFEFDVNHVLCSGSSAGETVILGVQCATADGVWEVTYQDSGGAHWARTDQTCSHSSWTAGVFHSVETFTSHDAIGNVTYTGASLDGTYIPFTCGGDPCIEASHEALGWSPDGLILINYQQDMDSSSMPYSWKDYLDLAQITSSQNAYLTSSGAPSGNCNGAPLFTPAEFNTSSNWGTASGQIGAGTLVLACGTFSGSANATLLNFQGGGASGNPVTLKLDPSANLTAPYWNTANGAIEINGVDNITVDGGGSGDPGAIPSTWSAGGVIQNTCNGSSNAISGCATSYQQPSKFIVITNASNITIQNLEMDNLYLRSGNGNDASGCPSSYPCVDDTELNDVTWGGTISNLNINHNRIGNTGWALLGSGVTDVASVSHNEIYNAEHGIAGAPPRFLFFNNHQHDWAVWDAPCPSGNCPYHEDGLHCFAGVQGGTNLLVIANNQFDGATTAGISGDAGFNQAVYVEGYGSNTTCMTNGGQVIEVNNVCIMNSAAPACLGDTGDAAIASWTIANAGTGYEVGDVLTIVQGTTASSFMDVTAIGAGGSLSTLALDHSSSGRYSNATGLALTGGHGSGATLNITVATGNVDDYLANNTVISNQASNTPAAAMGVQESNSVTWVNNASGGFGSFVTGATATFSILDYDFYENCSTYNCYFFTGIADTGSFATWQTENCTGSTDSCDEHGGANLSSSSYLGLDSGCIPGSVGDPCVPASSSPLHGGGKNLYSVCNGQPNPGLGILCYDKNGVPRPSSGAWDAGAVQFSGGNAEYPSETLSTSDGIARSATLIQAIGDNTSVSESIGAVRGHSGTIPDNLSTSDSIGRILNSSRSIAETLSTTEAIGREATLSRAIADALNTSESINRLANSMRSMSETLTTSDAIAIGDGTLMSDGLSTSDSLAAMHSHFANIAESLTTSDAIIRQTGNLVLLNESLSTNAGISVADGAFISLSQDLLTSESIGRSATLARPTADSISASDTIARQAGDFASISDSVAISESIARTQALSRAVGETLSVADAIVRTGSMVQGISDSTSVSDAIARQANYFRFNSESLSTSDSIVRNHLNMVYPVEMLTTFETISRTAILGRTIADSESTIDTVVGGLPTRPAPQIFSLGNFGISAAGSCGFSLTIIGRYFNALSVASWNGSARATSYLAPGVLTMALSAQDLAQSGQFQVVVTNVLGNASSPRIFTVVPATPAIAGVRLKGSILILDGTNFAPTTEVEWNGTPLSTTFIPYTRLQANLPPGTRALGSNTITAISPACPY